MPSLTRSLSPDRVSGIRVQGSVVRVWGRVVQGSRFRASGTGGRVPGSAFVEVAAAALPRPAAETNYFTEMCSGSEAGSYLRLIDFVYHSTLGLRVIKKKKKKETFVNPPQAANSNLLDVDSRRLNEILTVHLPLGKRTLRQRYRGTSLIRNSAPLGPYSRTKHRALWWP